ncbi:MAG: dTDP-4-dehydrorhamnose 3,5-epimerase, partial [uncultured Gemmatimonadaceae bacterium]
DLHRDAARGRLRHRHRAPRGLARVLRAYVRRARVRRARHAAGRGAVQRVLQRGPGDAARPPHAAAAGHGAEARALHARGGPRRDRRHAPRLGHVPAPLRRRADGGEPPAALRPGHVRPRLPDPGGRGRGRLQRGRVLRARARARAPLRRPGARHRVADRGRLDLRQGPGLAAARRRAAGGPRV